MHVMKIIVSIILSLLILAGISSPALSASEENASLPYLSLSEFLDEMDMDLERFIAQMKEFAQSGVYPHYLEKNAARYEAYRAEHPDIPFANVIAYVNVDLDKEHYLDVKEAQDFTESSILLNKTFFLPSFWSPDDLTEIGSRYLMRAEAAENILLMQNAITEDGLRLHIVSTYRPHERQVSLYNRGARSRGVAAADRNYARPGHSEHQTGLAVDLLHRSHGGSLTSARFENSELFTWLMQNAHEYGFILRYPEEYKEFHGYIFEPWHWRFVGVSIATAMHNEKMALYEEFYGRYITSDVLHRARELIYEHRAAIDAEAAAVLAAEEAAAQEAQKRDKTILRKDIINGNKKTDSLL